MPSVSISGGTSSDISIMHNGEIRVTQDWSVEPGYPIWFPSIDLITIGAAADQSRGSTKADRCEMDRRAPVRTRAQLAI